jgi:hypothetical protein
MTSDRKGEISGAHYAQMYAALKRIKSYQSVESLHRHSHRDYGVDAFEAIEMSYENILAEAKDGLHKVRKPPLPAGRKALREEEKPTSNIT